MYEPVEKTPEQKSQSVANTISQRQSSNAPISIFVDNRPEAIQMQKLRDLAKNSPQNAKLRELHHLADTNSVAQKKRNGNQGFGVVDNRSEAVTQRKLQKMARNHFPQQPIQKNENKTSLPDDLESGIENLTSYSTKDVMGSYAVQCVKKQVTKITPTLGFLSNVTQLIKHTVETSDVTKFIGDDGISKTEFLVKLKEKIYHVADEVLGQIKQTADDCPYIVKWFSHYAEQDSGYIEKAIARYAPETTSASNIEEYMEGIANRVKKGLQDHVNTGSISDVPAEIIEEQHKPEDFLHIAQKSQSITQLSRLFGNRNAPAARPAAAPPRKCHYITQGGTALAQAGDRVHNLNTTSCGLVLGFGTNGIACFHWPFMTNSEDYHATFKGIVARIAPLNRIEIITNDFPNEQARDDYIESALAIQEAGGVATSYYVRDRQFVGDPSGTLTANHFDSGGLREIFSNECV